MTRRSAFISKVLVPGGSLNTIRRGPLLARFLSDPAPILTVVAPAGFGKTTLLIDAANEFPGDVSWLSLDQWDRDPVTFLSYLRAALAGGRAGPDEKGIGRTGESLHQALGEIVSQAAAGRGRIIVLDDFHSVEESQAVVGLVDYLAQRLPPGMKLALTSRRPVPLPSLAKLRLEGHVSEFGPDDLAFARDEIRDYFSARGREITDAALERVVEATGGWPAGVALIEDPSSAEDLRTTTGAIGEYLGAEVLRGLPDRLRQFLQRTSVLDVLDADACNYLLEDTRSAETIRMLTRSSIPQTRAGARGTHLRIHPLVRDYLRSELKAADPALYRRLQLRAAQRAEGLGQQLEAVTHYVESEDWPSVARVVEEQAPVFYAAGRWHTVAAWIRSFPAALLRQYPSLRWWEARILSRLGEVDGALRVITEAAAGLDQPLAIAAFETLRAAALRAKGDVAGALASARQAVDLSLAHNAPIDTVAEARKELGLAQMAEGALSSAVEEFRAVLALQDRRGKTEDSAFVNGCLGSALGAMGRLSEAAEHLERARQQWQIVGNTKELAWVLNNLGMIYQRIGQPELARDVFTRCVSKSRQSGNRRAETYALVSLADAQRDAADLKAALDNYQAAYDIAAEMSDQTALTHARCGLALCYAKLGDIDRGVALARQSLVSARDRSSTFEEGVSLSCLGRLLRQKGDSKEAVSNLSAAVSLFEQTSSTYELAQTLLYLADAALPNRRSRSLVQVSLERFVAVAQTLGENVHSLVPASEVARVLEFGISRRLGGSLFKDMLRHGQDAPQGERAPSGDPTRLPTIHLHALGAFEVTVGGRTVMNVEWESEKAREMFLLLATAGRPLSRDEIIASLWPDAGGPRASSLFHSTLHRLRNATYKESVIEAGGRYRFNPEARLSSDVDLFRRGAARSDSTDSAGAAGVASLREALAAYQGPFAPGVEADWADALRTSLEDLFLRSATRLAQTLSLNGDHRNAIAALERVLDVDPFSESACLMLMRAYAHSGDVDSALRAFRRFSENLELELGESPGEDLVHLSAELRGLADRASQATL